MAGGSGGGGRGGGSSNATRACISAPTCKSPTAGLWAFQAAPGESSSLQPGCGQGQVESLANCVAVRSACAWAPHRATFGARHVRRRMGRSQHASEHCPRTIVADHLYQAIDDGLAASASAYAGAVNQGACRRAINDRQHIQKPSGPSTGEQGASRCHCRSERPPRPSLPAGALVKCMGKLVTEVDKAPRAARSRVGSRSRHPARPAQLSCCSALLLHRVQAVTRPGAAVARQQPHRRRRRRRHAGHGVGRRPHGAWAAAAAVAGRAGLAGAELPAFGMHQLGAGCCDATSLALAALVGCLDKQPCFCTPTAEGGEAQGGAEEAGAGRERQEGGAGGAAAELHLAARGARGAQAAGQRGCWPLALLLLSARLSHCTV